MAETDPLATGARTWPCAYSCCRKTSEKQTTLRPREVPQCKESCQAAFNSWSGRAACCIKEERLPAAQGRSSSGSSFPMRPLTGATAVLQPSASTQRAYLPRRLVGGAKSQHPVTGSSRHCFPPLYKTYRGCVGISSRFEIQLSAC
jgi:hypothetical protein